MKKILPFLVLALFVFPIFAGAHGDTEVNEPETRFEMMEHMEDQILGDELHEEMESLMINMMNGNLSDQEISRLTELMEQYPGPHGMMMNRLYGSSYQDKGMSDWSNMGWGMHSGFGNWSGMFWLLVICTFVWLLVGVMVIVYLGRKIGEDE